METYLGQKEVDRKWMLREGKRKQFVNLHLVILNMNVEWLKFYLCVCGVALFYLQGYMSSPLSRQSCSLERSLLIFRERVVRTICIKFEVIQIQDLETVKTDYTFFLFFDTFLLKTINNSAPKKGVYIRLHF